MTHSREPSVTAPVVVPPTIVVGSRYCAPYPIELEVCGASPHSFTVKNVNGSTLFTISMCPHHSRVLRDAAGKHILTLRKKILTAHDRWQVFMGGSTEHLLFTAKRRKIFQRRTELHVFLANNPNETDWDFKVEGSWTERSCDVHAAQSPNNIATLRGFQPNAFENGNFIVRVEANVDHAFIVALIVILDEIN